MKLALMMGVGCAAVLLAASVSMAENGRISNKVLSDMGLAGMTIMSDEAATEVRGMGYKGGKSYAYASGSSWANIGNGNIITLNGEGNDGGGAGTNNRYRARGSHHADGYNFSAAGYIQIGDGPRRPLPPWNPGGNQIPTTTTNSGGGGGLPPIKVKVYFAGGFSGANAW